MVRPRFGASKNKKTTKSNYKTRQPAHEYELEVLQGLERVAETELLSVPLARDIRGLRFWYPGSPERLNRMRSVMAVYLIKTWDVPRPKGLLGHQQLRELTEFILQAQSLGGHKSFRISAAGKDTGVMQRLTEEIKSATGLEYDPSEGDMVIRLRPSEDGFGWEVLARITTRPLSARIWRAKNMEGGMNATIAYAMHKLAGFREEDRIFNPMCGSGTLLIERLLMGPYEAMVGVDISDSALDCSRANLAAAGKEVETALVDALKTGLPPRSFDLIIADLPWGDAVGSHKSNAQLYPEFLKEMHRLCSRRGRVCVLTHEIKLFESLLDDQAEWDVRELFQVYSGGHYPKAYLLSKR